MNDNFQIINDKILQENLSNLTIINIKNNIDTNIQCHPKIIYDKKIEKS